MRVPGDEAHIEIGLADLFIAAAPALQILSLHNVIYVPQCMIYLIEGLELSIVNDIMSVPHRAIIQALHAIYASTDPCFMQSIEVMYELRAYADYFIASPTETPGTGAPYDAILPYLFGNGRAADLAKTYYEVYSDLYEPARLSDNPWTMGAAICVAESVGLEALASATREALQALEAPANCKALREQAFDYDKRKGTFSSSLYVGYYDLVDVMQALLDEDAYAAWKQAYDEVVIYYNTTDTNYSSSWGNFSMTGTHGVTQYLPSAPGVEACEAYHTLDWYDAAGISALGW